MAQEKHSEAEFHNDFTNKLVNRKTIMSVSFPFPIEQVIVNHGLLFLTTMVNYNC